MQPRSIFLAIEGSFSKLTLALFDGSNLIEKVDYNNRRASSLLLQSIKNLLDKNSKKLSDLKFIATNQGPGAFTSLRVTIASLNGISFATKIPLVGVDGLDALAFTLLKNFKKTESKEFPEILIPCLNAYGNDIHFSVTQIDKNFCLNKIMENQYCKIDKFIEIINSKFPGKIILIGGNGVFLHKKEIKIKSGKTTLLFDEKLETASVEQIGIMAFDKWKKNETTNKLKPLYLKSQTFAVKK